MGKEIAIIDTEIIDRIYLIRGKKVMFDRDLAILYGVETKQLKRQVRRNIHRFPEDFMFELTQVELLNWRSQFGTSNSENMGLRYSPFAFTEQGVAMLSSVLNSETAIGVNIQIIRIFARMREMVMTHKDILLKLEQMETKLEKHDGEIGTVFKYLKELLNPPPAPRKRIGYKKEE
jgi:hypothetical protein